MKKATPLVEPFTSTLSQSRFVLSPNPPKPKEAHSAGCHWPLAPDRRERQYFNTYPFGLGSRDQKGPLKANRRSKRHLGKFRWKGIAMERGALAKWGLGPLASDY